MAALDLSSDFGWVSPRSATGWFEAATIYYALDDKSRTELTIKDHARALPSWMPRRFSL